MEDFSFRSWPAAKGGGVLIVGRTLAAKAWILKHYGEAARIGARTIGYRVPLADLHQEKKRLACV